jgi:hypothetical protein
MGLETAILSAVNEELKNNPEAIAILEITKELQKLKVDKEKAEIDKIKAEAYKARKDVDIDLYNAKKENSVLATID